MKIICYNKDKLHIVSFQTEKTYEKLLIPAINKTG